MDIISMKCKTCGYKFKIGDLIHEVPFGYPPYINVIMCDKCYKEA